jgi:hypothetical protein
MNDGLRQAASRERSEQAQNLRKLTGKNQQTQARATGSGRLRGLSGDKRQELREPVWEIRNPDRFRPGQRAHFGFKAAQVSH